MRLRLALAKSLLDSGHRVFSQNVQHVSLDEALFVPSGGFRSILGTIKHAAAWSHVYRSFAFDQEPVGWRQLDWPDGARDTIVKSRAYLDAVISWMDLAHRRWLEDLAQTTEEQLDEPRPLHWGDSLPLFDIVALIAHHHAYHAGEINQILSICRGEAWEEGEEVEENNVSTVGHRVIPPWKAGK